MKPSFGPPPPLYRSLVKLMHWSALGFLLAILLNGNAPFVKWGLIMTAVFWSVGYACFGLVGYPGPRLEGVLRKGFLPMHIIMMIMLDVTAVLVLNAEFGPLSGATRTVVLLTVGAGLLHGVFHLWRHTALGDGALRNMTPHMMHGLL